MNQDKFWSIARERAVMDRKDFADAWSNTGDTQVIADIASEIARFRAFKDMTFKESIKADQEGVRLALLAAECWYSGLYDAQVDREKREAAAMYKVSTRPTHLES